jgi:PST family polysaccharide transporter
VLAHSARGSLYHLVVSAATTLLGFLRAVLLMRLLGPEQFGVVTLALFFSTFIVPFSVLGVDSALLQNPNPTPQTFSTHFTLRLLLAVGVLGLGLLASPVLRQLYAEQPLVVDVFLVLLIVNLLEASYATPGVILRREMRFGALALLNLFSSLAMTITAPLLAYLGFGLWSLVAEQAVGPLIRWIGIWLVLYPWRPQAGFDRTEAKASIKFGSHVLSSNLLGIMLDRFDDFWTGTVLGATALGYYSRAWELAQYPDRVLATPIINVFFSTYAAVQADKKQLSQAFFRSSSFLVRVGFLLAVVLLIIAPELTLILFGEAWLPIVPIFRLMLVYVLLDPLYNNLSYLIIGVGQPRLLTRVRLLQVALFVLAVIIFARLWGTNGVAMAANLMMLIGVVALLAYSHNFVKVSLRRMFQWPFLAVALSLGVGFALVHFSQWSGLWTGMILKALAAAGVYVLTLFLAERQVIDEYGFQVIARYIAQFRHSTQSEKT